MLWSLIKILFFLMAVAVITLGTVWLMESKGGVIIEYAGFELSFGALQAAILGILFTVALWIFLKVSGVKAFDWWSQIAKRICNEGAGLDQGPVP